MLITSHGNLNAKYCTCNNIQNRLVNVAMAGNMTQRISTGIQLFLQCCFFLWLPQLFMSIVHSQIQKIIFYTFFNCAIFQDYIC